MDYNREIGVYYTISVSVPGLELSVSWAVQASYLRTANFRLSRHSRRSTRNGFGYSAFIEMNMDARIQDRPAPERGRTVGRFRRPAEKWTLVAWGL